MVRGVLFFDCNATCNDAVQSTSPTVVHFDVVKAVNQFAVPIQERHFYQAEVLVPSPLPPDLIVFPEDQKAKPVKKIPGHAVRKNPVPHRDETKTEGGELPKPELPGVEGAESREISRCPRRTSLARIPSHLLDDGKALVSRGDVLFALGDEGERLFAKFNAWLVSMLLLYRVLAAVSLSLVFAVELRRYVHTLSFLDRLRLRHLTGLLDDGPGTQEPL